MTSIKKQGIVISGLLIRHYTENFTNETPFHKIVHILLAVLRLGHIAGWVGTFIMRRFVALSLCYMHMAQGLPNP